MSTAEEKLSKSGNLRLSSMGSEGPVLLFVTGPPASSGLFAEVQRRLMPRRTISVEFSSTDSPMSPEEMGKELLEIVEQESVSVVVAHGLALPLVLSIAWVNLDALVLSNGPLLRLDPYTRVLSRLPEAVLRRVVLQPSALNTWLASSIGLRRAVVNPYVMDKETVVSLTSPLVDSAELRTQTARWLKSLADMLPVQIQPDLNVVALWGDSDRLYPIQDLEEIDGLRVVPVAGGRFFFPKERPWEMADFCIESFE